MHEDEAVRDEGTVEGTVLPSILPAPAPALWLPHALARRGPVRAKLAVEKIPFHPEKAVLAVLVSWRSVQTPHTVSRPHLPAR